MREMGLGGREEGRKEGRGKERGGSLRQVEKEGDGIERMVWGGRREV